MPGHVCTIYQASNFIYAGRGTPRTLILLPDGTALTARATATNRKGDRRRQGTRRRRRPSHRTRRHSTRRRESGRVAGPSTTPYRRPEGPTPRQSPLHPSDRPHTCGTHARRDRHFEPAVPQTRRRAEPGRRINGYAPEARLDTPAKSLSQATGPQAVAGAVRPPGGNSPGTHVLMPPLPPTSAALMPHSQGAVRRRLSRPNPGPPLRGCPTDEASTPPG
jgi:hypothetical protein